MSAKASSDAKLSFDLNCDEDVVCVALQAVELPAGDWRDVQVKLN